MILQADWCINNSFNGLLASAFKPEISKVIVIGTCKDIHKIALIAPIIVIVYYIKLGNCLPTNAHLKEKVRRCHLGIQWIQTGKRPVFEKDHNVISHVRNHRLQVMKKRIVDDDRERGLVITVHGRISIHFIIFYFRNITTSTLSGTGKRGQTQLTNLRKPRVCTSLELLILDMGYRARIGISVVKAIVRQQHHQRLSLQTPVLRQQNQRYKQYKYDKGIQIEKIYWQSNCPEKSTLYCCL